MSDRPQTVRSDSALTTKQRELTAALEAIPNGQQRLAWLVERARLAPGLAEHLKSEKFHVEGCLSRLWLVCEFHQGRCSFRADSDSLIVKAVAGLLCDLYSGQTPGDILGHDPSFLGPLGITQHLTQNRRNGLAKVWERIRTFAANIVQQTAEQ